MTFLVGALVIAVILSIVLSPKRWRGLGQGARAFGKRFAGQLDDRKGRGPIRHAVARGDDGRAVVIVESELWAYRDPAFMAVDLQGFDVRATDGQIGTVEEANSENGLSYIVVSRGPSFLRKKRMLPASTILEVDPRTKAVLVDRSQDEIETAPAFDPANYRSAGYRRALARHYGTSSAAPVA